MMLEMRVLWRAIYVISYSWRLERDRGEGTHLCMISHSTCGLFYTALYILPCVNFAACKTEFVITFLLKILTKA